MTNRAKLWYVPVSASEKVMDVPPMPYKSSEQEAFGQDVYDEQKAFRSKKADTPASFCRDTPGAGKKPSTCSVDFCDVRMVTIGLLFYRLICLLPLCIF